MESANKLNYYQDVRWSASPGDMLGEILIDKFASAKIFANVNSEQDSLASDFTLITEISNFEVDDKTSGEVRLRLTAKLVDTKTREVVKKC